MQAQGNTIQGGMMGNFIQIYQKEGTKGLWKASIFGTVSYTSTALPCSVEFHVFLQYGIWNMEDVMSVICHDCFTAGVLVLFGEGLEPVLCAWISCHLGEGGQM